MVESLGDKYTHVVDCLPPATSIVERTEADPASRDTSVDVRQIIEGEIGYLRIPTFQAEDSVPSQLTRAALQLQVFDAIVIDLRGNPVATSAML